MKNRDISPVSWHRKHPPLATECFLSAPPAVSARLAAGERLGADHPPSLAGRGDSPWRRAAPAADLRRQTVLLPQGPLRLPPSPRSAVPFVHHVARPGFGHRLTASGVRPDLVTRLVREPVWPRAGCGSARGRGRTSRGT